MARNKEDICWQERSLLCQTLLQLQTPIPQWSKNTSYQKFPTIVLKAGRRMHFQLHIITDVSVMYNKVK